MPSSPPQSDVTVRRITLPRDAPAFISVWWRVYADARSWVPPLRLERRRFLDPRRNPYFTTATVQCYVAERGGRDLGTIAAHVDHGYQAVEPGVGFFGFFEFPDDEAVARALLDAALAFLRERGMRRAIGPLSFNTNHECGLLTCGFDADPLILTTYARPYYARVYERLGLVPVKELLAYWIDVGPVPDTMRRLAERAQRRLPGLRLRPMDLRDFTAEARRVLAIYNDAWEDNWGFVRMTEAEFMHMAKDLRQVLDPRFSFIAEIDGEPAAFSITLPDYNQVLKRMNGRLLPLGFLHLLRGPRRIDQLRVFALGVRRRYQHLPIGAPLYLRTWEAGLQAGMKGAEASWILEDNHRMRGALSRLGARVYKRYGIYGAAL